MCAASHHGGALLRTLTDMVLCDTGALTPIAGNFLAAPQRLGFLAAHTLKCSFCNDQWLATGIDIPI
jgi:hypothetical protein